GALVQVPHRLYTVHGFHFHEHSRPLQRHLYTTIERTGARLGHALHFVSHEDCETALRLKMAPPERCFWVGNGVDLPAVAASQQDATSLLPDIEAFRQTLPPGRLVVGFVGRLVAEKGID